MSLLNKCCRLTGIDGPKKIQRIIDNLEPGQTLHQGGDPEIKFDMTDEANGYPCIHLTESGCDIQATKPELCSSFPENINQLRYIETCSYSFDSEGNRSGTCDNCGS